MPQIVPMPGYFKLFQVMPSFFPARLSLLLKYPIIFTKLCLMLDVLPADTGVKLVFLVQLSAYVCGRHFFTVFVEIVKGNCSVLKKGNYLLFVDQTMYKCLFFLVHIFIVHNVLRMTNCELLRWLVEMLSRDIYHYRMINASRSAVCHCNDTWSRDIH